MARKNVVAVLAQPGREPQLGVAVAGRRVDVVDAVLEQQRQRLVGLALRDLAERRRAEDDAAAVMPGRSEWCLRDHAAQSTNQNPSSTSLLEPEPMSLAIAEKMLVRSPGLALL